MLQFVKNGFFFGVVKGIFKRFILVLFRSRRFLRRWHVQNIHQRMIFLIFAEVIKLVWSRSFKVQIIKKSRNQGRNTLKYRKIKENCPETRNFDLNLTGYWAWKETKNQTIWAQNVPENWKHLNQSNQKIGQKWIKNLRKIEQSFRKKKS